MIGHRRLQRPAVARNSVGDGAADFLIGPGADAGKPGEAEALVKLRRTD